MFHAQAASGNPVGFEHAHLGPTQPEPHPDDVVDFAGCGNVVPDKPKGLAPCGLKQAVAEVGLDLRPHLQRIHSDSLKHRKGGFDEFRCIRIGLHHLDRRQEVDRVEGVGDDDFAGSARSGLQVGRPEAGGGRGKNRARGAEALNEFVDLPLALKVLRNALLNPGCVAHGFLDTVREFQTALVR